MKVAKYAIVTMANTIADAIFIFNFSLRSHRSTLQCKTMSTVGSVRLLYIAPVGVEDHQTVLKFTIRQLKFGLPETQ